MQKGQNLIAKYGPITTEGDERLAEDEGDQSLSDASQSLDEPLGDENSDVDIEGNGSPIGKDEGNEGLTKGEGDKSPSDDDQSFNEPLDDENSDVDIEGNGSPIGEDEDDEGLAKGLKGPEGNGNPDTNAEGIQAPYGPVFETEGAAMTAPSDQDESGVGSSRFMSGGSEAGSSQAAISENTMVRLVTERDTTPREIPFMPLSSGKILILFTITL